MRREYDPLCEDGWNVYSAEGPNCVMDGDTSGIYGDCTGLGYGDWTGVSGDATHHIGSPNAVRHLYSQPIQLTGLPEQEIKR